MEFAPRSKVNLGRGAVLFLALLDGLPFVFLSYAVLPSGLPSPNKTNRESIYLLDQSDKK